MIKGIVFDKDGTLLDYEAFWVPVAKTAITELLDKNGYSSDFLPILMEGIGTYDGISGVLCYGTYGDIASALNSTLESLGVSHKFDMQDVAVAFDNNLHNGSIIPTCKNIIPLFKKLKSMGIKTAVITNDNYIVTKKCLKALKIEQFFDATFADDGINPHKTNPYYMKLFCDLFKLTPDEVIMVGDTLTDMEFAQNSGTKVMGVAKKESDKKLLLQYTDCIFDDISYVLELLNRYNADNISVTTNQLG